MHESDALLAISPVDGRYQKSTRELRDYFSEHALMKYRVLVEIEYFLALTRLPLSQLENFPSAKSADLVRLINQFDKSETEKIKNIEKTTNHDVKAVEYYLKEKFDELGIADFKEFIHFGLTSQDINNTAVPLSVKDACEQVIFIQLEAVIKNIESLAETWKDIPMLARTHGQPASPTRLGKEINVFVVRLKNQLTQLKSVPHSAKFGGATGNFNAHFLAYPSVDWNEFALNFIEKQLGLQRSYPTTQIEHYDNLAALCQAFCRVNTILTDFCRDIWTYISMDYFGQKIQKNEVGSSAMPHKVNPIDFENAEGNLGLANAIFYHLAEKLPVSRLQRDLTDSTVMRNIGVPFAHMLIAFKSIQKGLSKLVLNERKIAADLEDNWMVVAEGIQNILRREGFPNPYETLKELTRVEGKIGKKEIAQFIDNLDITAELKNELKQISPQNYVGK